MSNLPKKEILLVEDMADTQFIFTDLLEMNGFRVISSYTGEEALETLKHKVPDLVLLDINLPEMDGFQVFTEIRKMEALSNVPVLAFTALALEQEINKIKEAGFDGYVSKPVDFDTFIESLNQFLS